jgi:murein L,D-transpeptidase YafK
MAKPLLISFGALCLSLVGLLCYNLWPRLSLPLDVKADRVVVLKSERRLLLYSGRALLRDYRIALGFTPEGAKEREGDGKTPEGRYVIDYRNPNSGYHRSLHISYPTAEQMTRARAEGVSAGGMIMIHGLRNGLAGWLGRLHRLVDWTAGCIAVTNDEMDEIWRLVPDGTSIEIRA